MKVIVESVNGVAILIDRTTPSSDEVGTVFHSEDSWMHPCIEWLCFGVRPIQSDEERHRFRQPYNVSLVLQALPDFLPGD